MTLTGFIARIAESEEEGIDVELGRYSDADDKGRLLSSSGFDLAERVFRDTYARGELADGKALGSPRLPDALAQRPGHWRSIQRKFDSMVLRGPQ